MTAKTDWERNHTRRLAAQITIPIEPRVFDKLGELARASEMTRTEYVRAIIMRAIEPQTEGVT